MCEFSAATEISIKASLTFAAVYVSTRSSWNALQMVTQHLKLTVWLNGREKLCCLESASLRHAGFENERVRRKRT